MMSDDSLKTNAITDQFGLVMNTMELGKMNQIDLVARMNNKKEMWKLEFIKHPPDSKTEYSIDLDFNPIRILFYPKTM